MLSIWLASPVVETTADVLAIHQLVALHGHLVDDRAFDRLGELVTPGAVYDVSALGQGVVHGRDGFRALIEAFADDERNPVAHHVTNVVVTSVDGDRAAVRSKGFGILRDGRTGSVVYDDEVVRTTDGWRIAARSVRPAQVPGRR
jgi:3-phenylpropionate/cinnamic acid dioxygenase small subunit